ncbi:MAG: RloB domain-containing protein, partial [Longicatena sp.]
VKLAKKERIKLINADKFKSERDIMIVTFDLDVFKNKDSNLLDLLKEQDDNLIFGLANPDFELYLLLHIENSLNTTIIPNKARILENEKEGKQRPCQRLLKQLTGLNPKKNEDIGKLAENVNIAISQEKHINQNSQYFLTELSSNIGTIIEKMKEEKSPFQY